MVFDYENENGPRFFSESEGESGQQPALYLSEAKGKGKAVIVRCPKLYDSLSYVEDLSRILRESSIKSVTIAHTKVPCCFGLNNIVKEALRRSGKSIPSER